MWVTGASVAVVGEDQEGDCSGVGMGSDEGVVPAYMQGQGRAVAVAVARFGSWMAGGSAFGCRGQMKAAAAAMWWTAGVVGARAGGRYFEGTWTVSGGDIGVAIHSGWSGRAAAGRKEGTEEG